MPEKYKFAVSVTAKTDDGDSISRKINGEQIFENDIDDPALIARILEEALKTVKRRNVSG